MAVEYAKGLTPEQIDALQVELDRTLPGDYRGFLERYNGWYIDRPNDCELPYDGVESGQISFDAFLGYGLQNESFNLVDFNGEFADEIAFVEDATIVGSDPGGNPYVLVGSGPHAGVYCWDRTHLHSQDERRRVHFAEVDESGDLYRVADSFQAFLDRVTAAMADQSPEFAPTLA